MEEMFMRNDNAVCEVECTNDIIGVETFTERVDGERERI